MESLCNRHGIVKSMQALNLPSNGNFLMWSRVIATRFVSMEIRWNVPAHTSQPHRSSNIKQQTKRTVYQLKLCSSIRCSWRGDHWQMTRSNRVSCIGRSPFIRCYAYAIERRCGVRRRTHVIWSTRTWKLIRWLCTRARLRIVKIDRDAFLHRVCAQWARCLKKLISIALSSRLSRVV